MCVCACGEYYIMSLYTRTNTREFSWAISYCILYTHTHTYCFLTSLIYSARTGWRKTMVSSFTIFVFGVPYKIYIFFNRIESLILYDYAFIYMISKRSKYRFTIRHNIPTHELMMNDSILFCFWILREQQVAVVVTPTICSQICNQ